MYILYLISFNFESGMYTVLDMPLDCNCTPWGVFVIIVLGQMRLASPMGVKVGFILFYTLFCDF